MLYIVTLAQMKLELGITDPEMDAQVTSLLEGIQGAFASHCRRTFLYSSSIEQIFDGGEVWLLARAFPIDFVASIDVDEDQSWTADSLLASTDYRISKPRGRISYGVDNEAWPDGVQNIRVVYSGGLVQADGSAAPGAEAEHVDSLRRAVRMQAAFEFRNRLSLGNQSVSAQGTSVSLAPAKLLPEVQEILANLQR